MSGQPGAGVSQQTELERRIARHDVSLSTLGQPNALASRYDFSNESYEWRRVFAELFGTFLLVFVAVGGPLVNARFGGHVISSSALVVAPGMIVLAVILFMGAVSGAHLNPAVTLAFTLRADFPWRRVPLYLVAQFAGAMLATLVLVGIVGKHGAAGLTLPGPGISTVAAMLWEILLTVGLTSVILGTASGAQQIGAMAAIGVGGYIALAGLIGAPISGASMNPARSLGPALILGNWTSWWAYLAGPLIGSLIAVGFARILRGRGGGAFSKQAAQGTLGVFWVPGRPGPGDQPSPRNVPGSGGPPNTGGPGGAGDQS